jgi:hypothetical protein
MLRTMNINLPASACLLKPFEEKQKKKPPRRVKVKDRSNNASHNLFLIVNKHYTDKLHCITLKRIKS